MDDVHDAWNKQPLASRVSTCVHFLHKVETNPQVPLNMQAKLEDHVAFGIGVGQSLGCWLRRFVERIAKINSDRSRLHGESGKENTATARNLRRATFPKEVDSRRYSQKVVPGSWILITKYVYGRKGYVKLALNIKVQIKTLSRANYRSRRRSLRTLLLCGNGSYIIMDFSEGKAFPKQWVENRS